ncbi:MAG: hypothetical protein M3Q19_08890 [Pseudomonadota bacterium]|nr:hypothetical protein [Pseudomonadota bacterium]
MTTVQIIEVAVAALLIGAGIWRQVRTRRTSPNRGSQTAVILIFIGLILAIHGLGLLEYRPSEGELARAQAAGN